MPEPLYLWIGNPRAEIPPGWTLSGKQTKPKGAEPHKALHEWTGGGEPPDLFGWSHWTGETESSS
jgi:hypothetical protein